MMNSSLVYNEDCYETLQRIESGTVDLLLQDTPFGVTQNDWDIKPDLQKMWPEWERVAAPNAAFIFFATQPFASELVLSNPKLFRYDLIWYKQLGTGFLNANKMPMRNHESLLVFYKNLPTYNPQKRLGQYKAKGSPDAGSSNYGDYTARTKYINNTYFPESVLDFTNGNKNRGENFHPTQKPIPLLQYLIRTYSNKGDLIWDGYTGSGTTRIACHLEGRRFIGSELDKDYYEAQEKRFALAIQQQTLSF